MKGNRGLSLKDSGTEVFQEYKPGQLGRLYMLGELPLSSPFTVFACASAVCQQDPVIQCRPAQGWRVQGQSNQLAGYFQIRN
jgi:hypothetical protein